MSCLFMILGTVHHLDDKMEQVVVRLSMVRHALSGKNYSTGLGLDNYLTGIGILLNNIVEGG